MLRKEAVSNELLTTIDFLMGMPVLDKHRLVGGTALALQIGHRISVDIDLFCDSTSDYSFILSELEIRFKKNYLFLHNINSPMGKGVSVLLNGIKTDILDWKTKFNFKFIEANKIRLTAKEDIVGMKLDTFLCPPEYARYEKKDYTDLAFLLKEFKLAKMIELYKLRHPTFANPDRLVLEGLQWHQLADKKPNPKMLIEMSWIEIKKVLDNAVEEYLKNRMNE